jgi:hypothetical protein
MLKDVLAQAKEEGRATFGIYECAQLLNTWVIFKNFKTCKILFKETKVSINSYCMINMIFNYWCYCCRTSDDVTLCILPPGDNNDVTVHIHHTLMEAFCLENDIKLLKVRESAISKPNFFFSHFLQLLVRYHNMHPHSTCTDQHGLLVIYLESSISRK